MIKNTSNKDKKNNKSSNIKTTNSMTADPDPNMHKPVRGLPKV